MCWWVDWYAAQQNYNWCAFESAAFGWYTPERRKGFFFFLKFSKKKCFFSFRFYSSTSISGEQWKDKGRLTRGGYNHSVFNYRGYSRLPSSSINFPNPDRRIIRIEFDGCANFFFSSRNHPLVSHRKHDTGRGKPLSVPNDLNNMMYGARHIKQRDHQTSDKGTCK